ncbi:MAG: bifunctional nicotinamidase/pyrazinamidase [Acinetobacter populi]|uniref:bifunctional nicotinamidase/pyrazinamidase n=1 Tax=Acinetobacter populi TaxID=1582270 RepID=UPI00235589FF|nr:bifunctional nicotinamidase/pyrazinamidase [Acinetobacter populi]MCH4246724.1 bifunctional nicotinamidase/pyrazinamidase [Acinetobacter populi]
MQINQHSALIVIDVQNGFCPGGHLAVAEGDQIVPLINQLAGHFANIVITQDWHPDNHISFAENHPGKQPFETITLDYGPQVLWPSHCVQGSHDAELHPDLQLASAQLILRKGFHTDIDSYSAFVEADQQTQTGLSSYLKERQIDTVFLVGLATDFCVAWSALDARKFGFETYVIEDACRGIDLNGSLAEAWHNMQNAGVHRIHSYDILK